MVRLTDQQREFVASKLDLASKIACCGPKSLDFDDRFQIAVMALCEQVVKGRDEQSWDACAFWRGKRRLINSWRKRRRELKGEVFADFDWEAFKEDEETDRQKEQRERCDRLRKARLLLNARQRLLLDFVLTGQSPSEHDRDRWREIVAILKNRIA